MDGLMKYRERQDLPRESTTEAFPISVRLFALGQYVIEGRGALTRANLALILPEGCSHLTTIAARWWKLAGKS
jgi:hypothetical protein